MPVVLGSKWFVGIAKPKPVSLRGVSLSQVVPAEDAGEGGAEEDEDPSLLQDEIRQATAARKAKLHR